MNSTENPSPVKPSSARRKASDSTAKSAGAPSSIASVDEQANGLTMLDAALALAKKGFHVFPCQKRGKAPMTKHGCKDASNDCEKITSLWHQSEESNIGIATGRDRGIWALDIDSSDGEEWLAEMELQHSPLDPTYTVRTAKGRHLYFAYPKDVTVTIRNSQDKKRFPADVRGEGGHVIAPPSIHPSGTKYEVLVDAEPAEAPDWLVRIVTMPSPAPSLRKPANLNPSTSCNNLAKQVENRIRAYLAKCPEAVSGQAGHDTAYGIVCNVVLGFNLGFDNAIRLLGPWNQTCRPPWSDRELAHKVNEALRAAPPPGKTPGWLLEPVGCREYAIHEGRICRVQQTKDGTKNYEPLADFEAKVTKETVRDDGAERTVAYELQGRLPCGKPLPTVVVPVASFEQFDWVAQNWGLKAQITPGRNIKDELRYAIALLSDDAPQETVCTHMGWRELDGEWRYLSGSGAIGAAGLSTSTRCELPDSLGGFRLPAPPADSDLGAAVESCLRLFDLAAPEIMAPIVGGVFRSVINPCDFSIFLEGQHGVYKSQLAGLAQAFFGTDFNGGALPASWRSTANHNEILAFTAKDALLVVDDFSPRGTTVEVTKLHAAADALFRGAANRQGRGRLRPDATMRPVKPPRGLLLATGEDLPQGQSLRGRLVVVGISKNAIGSSKLTACQTDAAKGLYAEVMASFIRWLAPRLVDLRRQWPALLAKTSAEVFVQTAGASARTPRNLAELYLGFQVFCDFIQQVGAVTQEQIDSIKAKALAGLARVQELQNHGQQQTDPVDRFFELLRDGHASGRLRFDLVRDCVGMKTRSASCIGFRSETEIWLLPEESYRQAQLAARDQGEPFAISKTALAKRMRESGILIAIENGRTDVKRQVSPDDRPRVWVISQDRFEFGNPECNGAVAPGAATPDRNLEMSQAISVDDPTTSCSN